MTDLPDPLPTVRVLRELFRNLPAWRSLYETDGLHTLTNPADGQEYHLLDIEVLYAYRDRLSPRQRQAIDACLVDDQREVDVAIAMGVSETNPVASYATQGLRRILAMYALDRAAALAKAAEPTRHLMAVAA